ncbi:MAG: ATP-binding protein [Candidatus Bipolaricaulota bacterium]|nr:sensor histidine kinase [Candidatus Bipolaricaulota bacterium]
MIEDLAMHLADLVENSLRAGARHISVALRRHGDWLEMEVCDDGCGIADRDLPRAVDPFYTTKPRSAIGLGLPLLAQTAEGTGGTCSIARRTGGGMRVVARWGWEHPDRPPLGDIVGTLVPLIATSPEVEFTVELGDDRGTWRLRTGEVREHLGEVPFTHPDVLRFLESALQEGIDTARMKEGE